MFEPEEIIKSTGAKLKGIPKKITGVSTDTRSIRPGDLFISLKGENFDGNNFIGEAELKGAAAVMTQLENSNKIAQFIVPDTTLALQDLGSCYRNRFNVPVIGVTGSFGKTTVKEMIAAVLSKVGNPVYNLKNLNNEIGVPITLFNLNDTHTHAVIEMGMNHPGEINTLSRCAKPDVAVITGIGTAHIEFFDSIQDIANAKLEILNGLKKGGTVVLPGDDSLFNYLKEKTESAGNFKIVTFGQEGKPDVRFVCEEESIKGVKGKIFFQDSEINIDLKLIGSHNGLNAAAAVAAALAVKPDIKPEEIKMSLDEMPGVEMRCEIKCINGINFILDCYNANLESGTAALLTLARIKTTGKKIAFLGDMLEQGTKADGNHYELGRRAAENKIDLVVATGKHRYRIKAGALEGMTTDQVFDFSDKLEAANFLRKMIKAGDIVLVKASRLLSLEKIVESAFEKEKLIAA